jgi:hypothetical protein
MPNIMLLTKTFSAKIGAKTSLKDMMNCKTANVIYLISCKVCNKQYVGETKLPLNKHRSDWKTRKFNCKTELIKSLFVTVDRCERYSRTTIQKGRRNITQLKVTFHG